MKTVVKLLIVAAILNATAHLGLATWEYYQLKDSAQQLVVFGAGATSAQLHGQIVATAAAMAVPLIPENVTVRREGVRTVAQASYTKQVELFPRRLYPMTFSFEVSALSMASLPPPR